MWEFLRLLWGTVLFRPYVYGFFLCFLFFALRHLRARGTAAYLILAYVVAYASEYSATRNGFPFGRYVYLDQTRTRELWLSNVPFWDSLSFVFLSYFSWIAAACALRPRDVRKALLENRTAICGGLLMMLLDVVIDPLTLLGDRWFLGKIYYYPDGGTYFGVTLSNFLGWWFVGFLTIWLAQGLAKLPRGWLSARHWRETSIGERRGVWGVYAGVMVFNLAITAWIGEWRLLACSLGVASITLGWGTQRGTQRLGARA